jgi:hypothetical protein
MLIISYAQKLGKQIDICKVETLVLIQKSLQIIFIIQRNVVFKST